MTSRPTIPHEIVARRDQVLTSFFKNQITVGVAASALEELDRQLDELDAHRRERRRKQRVKIKPVTN